MVTRMQHLEHGFDNAYDSAQLKRMEEAGWKKITDAEFKALLAAKSKPAEVESDEPVVAAPKKRGPKPKA